ncbi:MAG: cytochrome c [Smithella sp.]
MNKARLCICAAIVAGLGLISANMIFSNALAEGSDGAKLYAANCGGCHPGGGNVMDKSLPLAGSAPMKTLDAFIKFNRNPLKPDGSKGIMPAFSKEKISDQEMKMIYDYAKNLKPIKK